MLKDLESESNPALASILVFKAYNLLKENPYVLWKVLQEKLGRNWFVDVLVDRSKNSKYAIDYEPLEEILPTLNKMLIREKPDKVDFLAGENGEFIKYVVECFSESAAAAWKAVVDKDKLMDNLEREILTFNYRASVQKNEEEEGKSDSQYNAPRVAPDVRQQEVDMYKRKIATLINEIKNLQSDSLAQTHLNIVLEKRFGLIMTTLKDVFEKIGSELDFKNFKNSLHALRKTDAKALQALGIEKIIAAKKIEMLAKLVILNTGYRGMAHKATSTNTQTYTDLMYDESELMGNLIVKIKTSNPGKIEGRSGYDGKSGNDGSRYSKSNNRMYINSQASKLFNNNDKRKLSQVPNNAVRRPGDMATYRNNTSLHDGSGQGSYDGLKDEWRQDKYDKTNINQQIAKLGSDLEAAGSPRSKYQSIENQNGAYRPAHHGTHVMPIGKWQKQRTIDENFSSRTIDVNLEFSKEIKHRKVYPRRSEIVSMLPSLPHSQENGMTLDRFIEMTGADKKKSRGESAGRKMSMFISRNEVEHLAQPSILQKERSPNEDSNSSKFSEGKDSGDKPLEELTSQMKNGSSPQLDVFLLDAIQIGITQDIDVGMYIKIISNYQANRRLLGKRSKNVGLIGPQNFLIYLSKSSEERPMRQAERRLIDLLEKKNDELERIKSLTVGTGKDFGYHIKNDTERERVINYVKFKNKKMLDMLHINLEANMEYAGLDNCDFANTLMTQTDMTTTPEMTQKQTVRLFDNLEVFNRENYPIELMTKMKRLEKEKDRFSMDGTVFDRLYKNSVLKSLVEEEKELVMKDLETNKWLKQHIKDYSVLYDINGTTLVLDKKTGKTFIDMNRTISRINLPGQGEVKLPIPSMMSQIDAQVLENAMSNLTRVETADEEFKQENNMIPVDYLKDGSLAVPITSLGLVVKKIFNQMYNVRPKQTKGTQTMTADALREVQRKVREAVPSQTATTFMGGKRPDQTLKKVKLPSRKILQTKLIDFGRAELHQSLNHGFYTERQPSKETDRFRMPRVNRSIH